MPTFNDFIAEIETEARAQGPEAVAELDAFRLYFCAVRLARVVDRDVIPAWLHQRLPVLGNATPAACIAAGDSRAVERLISGLEDPSAC